MKRRRSHRRREATPVAHMILSKRMADYKPHDMICELVDNSLDASAKRVWVELGRRSITVADDGAGMEDINDAIRFGQGTKAHKRGGVLGRFGVGMTDALCKLGPRAEIVTLHEGGKRQLEVDWEECLRNAHFPYLSENEPQPANSIEIFDEFPVNSGTIIRIHGQNPGVHLEKLRRLLTERYTPGIWSNREIFARREKQEWLAVEDVDPGRLTDVIEYEAEIQNMPYRVYGGLMVNRNVVYNRMFIGYSYRFIEDTTELFKGLSTAHLQVFLGDEWKNCLGTHKNRLELYRDVLLEDIRCRAKEWFAKAAEKAEALQLQSLTLELEQYLTKMADTKGNELVASTRRGSGCGRNGKSRQGETTGAGESEPRRPKRGIEIAWDSALSQMGELSVNDDGEIFVTLNPGDPRIRVLRQQRDCPGLAHVVCSYVAQFAAVSEQNARRVVRPLIIRGADPGLRAHQLYAYYYDRVDQPAVTHEDASPQI